MTALQNQIELANQLYREQNWDALNQCIDFSDVLNNVNDQLLHFKIVAMVNLETFSTSDALIKILIEHRDHHEHGGLYTQILIDTLISREEYDEATHYLLILLKSFPAAYQAYDQLSLCAQRKGDSALFDWAAARFHYYLAKAQLLHFNAYEAAESFEKSLGFTNIIEDTYWFAAKANVMIGNHQKASSYFDQVKVIPGMDKDLQLLRLDLALSVQDLPAIKAITNQLLEHEADNIDALRAQALSKEIEGDLFAAIQQHYAILKYYPYDVMANLKAIQLSRQLIEHTEHFSPHSDSQKLGIAMMMAEVGCDEASMNMLESIDSNSPEYRQLLFLVIDRMMTESDYLKASKHLECYLAKSPQDDNALVLYAKCHIFMDELERAIQIGSNALQINPNNFEAVYHIATAKYWLWRGGKQYTNEELKTLVDTFTDYAYYAENDSDTCFQAAQISYALGEIDTMKSYLDMAKDRGHVGGRASFLRGIYYQEYNFLDKAIEEYTQSIQLYSPGLNYLPYYYRALVALHIDNFDLAEQDVNILLTHWPDDQEAQSLLAEIKQERFSVENGTAGDNWLRRLKKSGIDV